MKRGSLILQKARYALVIVFLTFVSAIDSIAQNFSVENFSSNLTSNARSGMNTIFVIAQIIFGGGAVIMLVVTAIDYFGSQEREVNKKFIRYIAGLAFFFVLFTVIKSLSGATV